LTGVTAVNDSADSTPEELAAEMLPTIDEHHGVCSANPPYDSLHVVGARMSADLLAAAGVFGLSEISGRDLDFELRMPEPADGSR
jgi:hypothetical protein